MQLHKIAFILLVIGGLNWLAMALFFWDLSDLLGGMSSPLSRLVYFLVGLAALYEIVNHRKTCKACETPAASAQ